MLNERDMKNVPLSQYLEEISKAPMMSEEEQTKLFETVEKTKKTIKDNIPVLSQGDIRPDYLELEYNCHPDSWENSWIPMHKKGLLIHSFCQSPILGINCAGRSNLTFQ